MKWRNEDDHNRFICALRTLEVMITFRKWTEARAIVFHELDWVADPQLECAPWPVVYRALVKQRRDA